jgi:CRISPR-associated endonuclease/helicase Cas3
MVRYGADCLNIAPDPTGGSSMSEDAHGALAHSPGHPLEDHLRAVAKLAEGFGSVFGAGDWAHLAGLWHDLGKYRPGFQRYIRQSKDMDAHIEGRVVGSDKTHSAAGAIHAIRTLGPLRGELLAFLIAGHHAGLPDRDEGSPAGLKVRLASDLGKREFDEAVAQPVPPDILAGDAPGSVIPGGMEGFALWLRMLFSCLVDADFIDTEAYYDESRASRRGSRVTLAGMKAAFDTSMQAKLQASAESPVNRIRADVLAQCRSKGSDTRIVPGFFDLTVPTGGGKTLSSLAFALEHALAHGKRRIVYAIPFTSIIEQTAQVFREVFAALGDDAVIEHHSSLDIDERKEDHANRLAAENWDAPLIVSTNVQLFESLHAARTSRCRKLHNLVDSVIVLDEAQQLPRDFLAPVLRTLKLLVAHYGVSVVFCTATQPALTPRRAPVTKRLILNGIEVEQTRSIVDEPQALFDALRRVDIRLPGDLAVRSTWEAIAAEVAAEDCVLVIVNARKHARDLFALLPQDGAEHLSAQMCAEHRSAVIERIRTRLRDKRDGGDKRPLRVVSTQLVEAGVDLDFPVVYRALAGLDSIAQAAGRCNREGRLDGLGQVRVFVPPYAAPPGLLRQGEQTMTEMARTGRMVDPLAPATFRDYFNHFYAKDDNNFDKGNVLGLLQHDRAAFRTAAEAFRLIDDDGESVVVPYRIPGDVESPVKAWLNMLEKDGNARRVRRKMQRYTVSVPRRIFDQMLARAEIEERAGLWLALDLLYDERLGLALPDSSGTPADYVF